MNKQTTFHVLTAVVLLLAITGAAHAGSIAVSATAPTVDAADIAMLNVTGQYDTGGDEGHLWSNRPLQGQTFTTLGDLAGYSLSSVTLRNYNNNVANNAATWTVRVGTVSGTTFSPIASENSNNSITYASGDYLTFTFDTPVALGANTVYGFDWDTSGSGFVTSNNADGNYAGGTNFRHGGGGVGNDGALLFPGDDRVFHADLTAIGGSVPVILPIVGITGHQQGDSLNGDGSMLTAINGAGITKPDPADPATWTHANPWQTDWQGSYPGGSSSDADQGWAVVDLGAPQAALGDLYLWNVNEVNALDRGTNQFNIYYATSPTVTPPPVGGFQPYDFSSGGWTQLGGTLTLDQGTGSGALPVSGIFDISGASGAQYIGIDMLSNYGSTFRVGLAEIVVTAPGAQPGEIPEPITMLAVGLGITGLGGYIRKRRRS